MAGCLGYLLILERTKFESGIQIYGHCNRLVLDQIIKMESGGKHIRSVDLCIYVCMSVCTHIYVVNQ